MSQRRMILWLAAVASLVASAPVRADIYRCVDRGGHTLLTDAPCPKPMRTSGITRYPPACTSFDCVEREQLAREEAERRQSAAVQLAELQRIRELEQEIAALRSAPPPPVQPASQEAVQELPPAYPVVVLVNRCHGRHCGAQGHHDDDDGRDKDHGKVPTRNPPPGHPKH
jgi:hypothetical protein